MFEKSNMDGNSNSNQTWTKQARFVLEKIIMELKSNYIIFLGRKKVLKRFSI